MQIAKICVWGDWMKLQHPLSGGGLTTRDLRPRRDPGREATRERVRRGEGKEIKRQGGWMDERASARDSAH
jgi:hypothetical protein